MPIKPIVVEGLEAFPRRNTRPLNRRSRRAARRRREKWAGFEVLEPRLLLSTTTFFNNSVDYDGPSNNDPIITSGIEQSLANGATVLAGEFNDLENSGALDVHIPGLLERFNEGTFSVVTPPFEPELSDLLPGLDFSAEFSRVVTAVNSMIANSSRASNLVTALDNIDTTVTGSDGIDYVINVSGVSKSWTNVGGGFHDLSFTFTFTIQRDSGQPGVPFSFDPGRDMDQYGFVYEDSSLISGHNVELFTLFTAQVTMGTTVQVEQGDFDNETDNEDTPENEATAANDTRVTSNDSDFFINESTRLTTRVEAQHTGADALPGFNLRIGLLGIRVASIDFDLVGTVRQTIADPSFDLDSKITRAELDSDPTASVLHGGSFTITMPVDVLAISGTNFHTEVENGLSPTITLSDNGLGTFHSSITSLDPDNPDDPRTAPVVSLSQFQELLNFNNLSAGGLLSLMSDLAVFFNDLRNTYSPAEPLPDDFPFFDTPIPFATAVTLGKVLEIGRAFDTRLVFDPGPDPDSAADDHIKLANEDGEAQFVTFQEFIGILNNTDVLDDGADDSDSVVNAQINPRYNATTDEIRFDLDFTSDFQYDADGATAGVQDVPIDFNMDFNLDGLSDLGVLHVESDSQVSLTGQSVFNLTVGYKLTPLGDTFTPAAGTLLSSLNGGKGVGLITDGMDDIRVTLSDSSVLDINFDGATTIQHILNELNNAAPGNLVATLNIAGDRIDLQDNTFPGGATFRLDRLNGQAAVGLGLVSQDVIDADGDGDVDADDGTPDGVIEGHPFHGDSLAAHLFLQNSSVNSTVELTETPASGVATNLMRYGFVGLAASGGTALINGTIDVTLDEVAGGRSTLAQLRDGLIDDTNSASDLILADIVTVSVTGTGEVVLDNVVFDPGAVPGLSLGADPEIHITFNSLANPAFTVDFQDAGNVDDFTLITFEHIRDAILSVKDFLQGLADFTEFGQDLPIIGQSFADMVGFVQDIQNVVDDFADNPFPTVQQVQSRLIEALGLPSGDPAVQVSVAGTELLFNIVLDKSFTESLGVDLDLGLPGVANLAGSANLGASGGASVSIGLAIDLTNPANASIIDDQTSVDLNFRAAADNINFTAAIGPFALYIVNGRLVIDQDGDVTTTTPLSLSLSIADDGDNRHALSDPLAIVGDASVVFAGDASASLPVFFPSSTSYLGNVDISIDGDLNDFFADPLGSLDITTPDFASLLADFDLFAAIPLILDGLDQFLGGFQSFLDGEVFGLSFPLVGDALADANTFIEGFREGLLTEIRSRIEEAPTLAFDLITDALNDALGSILGGPVVHELITASPPSEATWRMPLQRIITADLPLGVGLGLPVLGIELDGSAHVELTFNLDFGFGVSLADGFFILLNDDTADGPEMTVDLQVTLPGFAATGNLLFLTLEGVDGDTDPTTPGLQGSHFGGMFTVDLDDPSDGASDNTQRLTFAELSSLAIAPELSGEAEVALDLTLGFGSDDFPHVTSTFILDWMFNQDDLLGDLPHVAFNDVTLHLGEFISGFLGDTLGEINETFIEPIEPFIDLVTTPIPVISDLAGEPITLLDLASLFGFVDAGLIQSITDVLDVISLLGGLSASETDISMNFGSFNLTNSPPDLRQVNNYEQLAELAGFGSVDDFIADLASQAGVNDFLGAFGTVAGGAVKDLVESVLPGTDGTTDVGGFEFPILTDPSQIVGLFLGRPAVLMGYDMAPLSFGFSYSQFFPIFGPLGASVTGSIGAMIDFAFGFDTYGVQRFAETDFKYPELIFDGFYISDNPSSVLGSTPLGTGPDAPEITLTGSLLGAAELNLGVARAGVGGGPEITITLDMNDPNTDGRVRGSEILGNLFLGFDAGVGPLAIFDVGVQVSFVLKWFLEFIIGPKFGGEIGRVDFPLGDIIFEKPPILGTLSSGELRLNTGPLAADRLYRNVTDGDENYTVTETAPGTIEVSAFGHTQTFTGVSSISGDLGFGNDSISFVNVTAPTQIKGGFGDDTITLGDDSTGAATISGGSGNDSITGGGSADVIDGEKGRDTVDGAAANDTITGGSDEDSLAGGAGDDSIDAGSENDTVDGGIGNDTIYGRDGDDSLTGGDHDDSILAGLGNDSVAGGGTVAGPKGTTPSWANRATM